MPFDAIVFDDDEPLAALAVALIEEQGFTATMRITGRDALNVVKESGARLVVLDIMMPGADGISILRSIRADPATKAVKVAIASSKSYDAEKERASQAGADLFLGKPYKREDFLQGVVSMLGEPPAKPAAAVSPAGETLLSVLGCWAAPPGRTCSVSLSVGKNLFLLGGGSGLADLPEQSIASAQSLCLFLTHAAAGHNEGIQRLAAVQSPAGLLAYAPDEMVEPLRQSLPPEAKVIPAFEDSYELFPGASLKALYAHHPGQTMIYAIETAGRKIVYAPANELGGAALPDFNKKMKHFCSGATALIHDAFAPAGSKVEGHSSWCEALDLALAAGAERLILFNHDPARPAEDASSGEALARKRLDGELTSLEVAAAKDGWSLRL